MKLKITKRTQLTFLIAFTALAVVASSANPPTGQMSTRKVAVEDPVYGIEAATLEIPANWGFAGTVARHAGCTSTGPAIKMTAQSADGMTAFETLPGYAWSWSSNQQMAQSTRRNGCTVMPVTNAAEFLKLVVLPHLRPGAELVEMLPPEPDVQARLDQQLGDMRRASAQMAGQYNQAPPKNILDGARAHITYSRSGQAAEEFVSTVIVCSIFQRPAMFNAPASQSNSCFARSVGIRRAPQGRLEELRPLFQKINGGVKFNEVWDQRITDDIKRQGAQALAQQRASGEQILRNGELAQQQRNANHQAFMQAQQERFDSAMANDRAKQAAIDHSAHQTVLAVQGRGDYTDPSTGQKIETSSQYNHVWRAADGSVLHTNDPSYDPNGRDGQAWTELEPQN